MHDDLDATDGSVDPLAAGQVTGYERDPMGALVGAPAEDAHIVSSVAQQLDHETPQGAGAARNQDA